MRVTVVGGAGRVGKRVARDLVARGHEVLAVNRRADRAAVVVPDLVTAVVDTLDPSAVARVVARADAVVLATMPTRERPRDHVVGTGHVLAAVRDAAVARLVVVSNHDALRAPDGRPLLDAEPPHPYFRPVEAVYADQTALLRDATDVDWLLVAPPPELYPYGDDTGEVRVTEGVLADLPARASLSMERLARFVADETVTPTYHRALVAVAE